MSVFYAIKDAVTYARKDAGLTGPFQIDSPATVERIRLACTDNITTLVSTLLSSLVPCPGCINLRLGTKHDVKGTSMGVPPRMP